MKYHNTKITVDGITFDSKKEMQRWFELKMLERAGAIKNLRRQMKYILIPSQRVNGKLIERECSYIADFVYTDADTGEDVVEDVKSPVTRTKDYIIKRKLMLYQYGLQIKEI